MIETMNKTTIPNPIKSFRPIVMRIDTPPKQGTTSG